MGLLLKSSSFSSVSLKNTLGANSEIIMEDELQLGMITFIRGQAPDSEGGSDFEGVGGI